jgi:hypothetical protein
MYQKAKGNNSIGYWDLDLRPCHETTIEMYGFSFLVVTKGCDFDHKQLRYEASMKLYTLL